MQLYTAVVQLETAGSNDVAGKCAFCMHVPLPEDNVKHRLGEQPLQEWVLL
jgi:hypothetical protein